MRAAAPCRRICPASAARPRTARTTADAGPGFDGLRCARYRKDKQRRMLYCRTCKARFSERKGTPRFGSQLTREQALSILEHLAERNGVRATGDPVTNFPP
jgi:hypothetical protein